MDGQSEGVRAEGATPVRARGRSLARRMRRRLARQPALAAVLVVVLVASALAAWAARPAPELSSPSLRNPAAALRSAIEARDAGNLIEADSLFELVSKHHAVVSDYADLLRARALLDQGATARAAVVCLEALQIHQDSPLRADFHPELTVVRGLSPSTREALAGEVIDALAGARPGVHLELHAGGRSLTVFRPETGRHRVIDTDSVRDVTDEHLGPDGEIDLFAAAGVDRALARRTIRFTRDDGAIEGEICDGCTGEDAPETEDDPGEDGVPTEDADDTEADAGAE